MLSVFVCMLVAAGMLFGSLLIPRTFQATGAWTGNTDPILAQIDHPPLHELTQQLLVEKQLSTPAISLTSVAGRTPGLLVTTRADSAQQAVDMVDEWLAQRAAHLTGQLIAELTRLQAQHQTQVDEQQAQLDELEKQIFAARTLIADLSLPTHEKLAVLLSDAQQKLDQLTRQQAVYMGANRTLKGLLSRQTLLKQDLAMHQQLGRSDDDPAVRVVKDQLDKLILRIDVIQKSAKLDTEADAKLAAVSTEIDELHKHITVLRGKQQQLVEQSQAAKLLGELQPRYQQLNEQLSAHHQQLALIDQVLTDQAAWGHIRQASVMEASVIWPTLWHLVALVVIAMLVTWVLLQLVLRASDRTLDRGMPIEQSLDLPILGQVTLAKRVSWPARLCRVTIYPLASVAVLLVLCASVTAAYVNLQLPRQNVGLWQMFSSPTQLQQIFYQPDELKALPPQTLPVVIELPRETGPRLSDKSS
jgi:capsular polysaccharide biosynthesis protein